MTFGCPERWAKHRVAIGGDYGDPTNGAVRLPSGLNIIFSDGMGWEHVSVSTPRRVPTWGEMHKVKRAFWSDDTAVMQLHPAESDYINCHPYCLHLWRPIGVELPLPPPALVGISRR